MQDSTSIKIRFSHLVLRGSLQEIGRAQGEMIRQSQPAVDFFASGPLPQNRVPVDCTLKLMTQYCPGLLEEMSGFCDGAGFALEKLVYLSMTHLGGNHCSHFAVLPAATASGHVLVGRNYDFGEKSDDMRLTTIFPEGGYAHTGFPTLFFGRNDGMNEHGLSVTMSVGGMPIGIWPGQRPPVQEGLQFWALVRTILETCKTTQEAEACFASFPCCGNPILILADAAGNVSLAEACGPQKKITRADERTPFMAATNHYLSPEMQAVDPGRMAHSTTRLEAIHKFLKQNQGSISIAAIKQLLSTKYPAGLCVHFYPEYFGTLHSCVFDLNECCAEVTFGSPAVNAWHHVDFADQHSAEYEVLLPYEHSTKDFWAAIA